MCVCVCVCVCVLQMDCSRGLTCILLLTSWPHFAYCPGGGGSGTFCVPSTFLSSFPLPPPPRLLFLPYCEPVWPSGKALGW